AQPRPHTAGSGTTVVLSAGSTVGPGDSVRSLLLGDVPVPGLGFDYPHLAAVTRNLEVRALVDPVTQQQLVLARAIRRETPVVPVLPVFVPLTPAVVVSPVVVQPLVSEPPPAQPVVAQVAAAPQPEAVAPPGPPPPVPELDQIVFLRRDGTLILAVAFSLRGDRIVYITPEGLRRSLLLSELDLEASEQMNEERGTTLQLRARAPAASGAAP
ncbi:MAG: hypothetical protein K6U02_03425, partial [Firmicutes bacterium]|nr:hypothetical protein [Bacillota bacterium]